MPASGQQLFFYSPEGFGLVKQAGTGYLALFRAAGQALAQRREGRVEFGAADNQGSVLQLLGAGAPCVMAYTAYGHDGADSCRSMLGFNRQRRETVTGHYLLGDGYRAFSPVLMRFMAPDSLSPFGDGGINAYAYCGGDPINRLDPSGHVGVPPNSFLTDGLFIKRWGLRALAGYEAKPGSKVPALKTLGVKKALEDIDPHLKSRVRNAQKNNSWQRQDVQRLENASTFLLGRKNRFDLAQGFFERKGKPIEARAAAETALEISKVLGWVQDKSAVAKAAIAAQSTPLPTDPVKLNVRLRTDR